MTCVLTLDALMSFLASLATWVNAYALLVSLVAVVLSTRGLRRFWRTRHLRHVWGIRDRDHVIVVCSELEDPEERQMVEPREFIYSLKYGDVDAYFEVVATLLRLYPGIKLRVMSAGEAKATRIDLARHLVLIGGPDYNALTKRVLGWKVTQFDYRSPYEAIVSKSHPDEIVLYDSAADREFCYENDARDFGYFERIKNPHNPRSTIVLIGGCHTTGVTGAVRAFSMAESEQGEIPTTVLRNAEKVSRHIRRARTFSVLFSVERVDQTISTPLVNREHITVRPTK